MSTDPDSGADIPDGMVAPFPDPGETAQDYAAEARADLVSQYQEKPKAIATVVAIADTMQGIEDCAVVIPTLDAPAVAGGVNLDVLGELVGQDRVLSSGTTTSDATYRLLIAARILKNAGIATSPDLIKYIEDIVLGLTAFRFYDLGGMTVGLEMDGEPNADQVALLDLDGPMPKAMGVGFIRVWYTAASYFGFAEDTNALGFGIESDAGVGGYFAMLF